MKKRILFFILVLFAKLTFAQNPMNQKSLSNVVADLVYSNPDESLKIATHLLDKDNVSEDEKLELLFLSALAHTVKGNYSEALTLLYLNVNKSDLLKAKELYLRIQIFEKLLLHNQVKIEYDKLVDLSNEFGSDEVKHFVDEVVLFEEFLKSSSSTKTLLKTNDSIISNNWEQFVFIDYSLKLVSTYIENSNYDFAIQKLEEVNKVLQQFDNLDYYSSWSALQAARINFYQKDFKKSLSFLELAQKNIEVIKNKYILEQIEELRVVNYIALNDSENYILSNSDFDKVHAEVEKFDQEAANVAYNLILEEQNFYNLVEEQKYSKIIKISAFVFLGFTLLLFAIWFKNYQKSKRISEIISYLKITRKNLIAEYKEKKEYSKKISIPQKTEEIILTKLKKFEGTTKYLNKDLSLAVLAGQFETNTKYLSEIINSNYNVNFNTYINKLRINYVVDKLKTDSNFLNYKISYLAESSGFSSHSSFATVFKSITGISPVKFIELLKEEKEKSVA